jgi:hypothetical protein
MQRVVVVVSRDAPPPFLFHIERAAGVDEPFAADDDLFKRPAERKVYNVKLACYNVCKGIDEILIDVSTKRLPLTTTFSSVQPKGKSV